MIVAIPSKGRAGRTTTDAFMTSAQMFVPVSERDDYKRAAKCNVVAVPNDVRGITRTRNWILDHRDEDVVFVDDDLEKAGWIEFFSHHVHYRELTQDEWLREFRRLFALTAQLGFSIFGVDTAGATRSTYPYKPFRFHTYLTASCMGVRNRANNEPIRFDESYKVKEDYELCLRCIEKDGGILAAQYVYWTNSHWTDAGGCADYRTQELEEDAIKRLMIRYPRLVRRVTRGGSHYSIELDF